MAAASTAAGDESATTGGTCAYRARSSSVTLVDGSQTVLQLHFETAAELLDVERRRRLPSLAGRA